MNDTKVDMIRQSNAEAKITHEQAVHAIRYGVRYNQNKKGVEIYTQKIIDYISQQEKRDVLLKKLLDNVREINTPQQKHFVFLASEYQVIKNILNELESELK